MALIERVTHEIDNSPGEHQLAYWCKTCGDNHDSYTTVNVLYVSSQYQVAGTHDTGDSDDEMFCWQENYGVNEIAWTCENGGLRHDEGANPLGSDEGATEMWRCDECDHLHEDRYNAIHCC